MKKFVAGILFTFLFSLFTFHSFAQCAMCKRVAETNYEQKIEAKAAVKKGKSLNNGILYLLSVPYVLGAVGAFAWWKNRKKF